MLFCLWCQLQIYLLGDIACDIALQQKDVAQLAVIRLCPNVLVGRAINQLSGDAYAIFIELHRALNYSVNVQLARDLWKRFVASLVLQNGGVGNNF